MKRYVLALDFGASSGRAMLACYDGNSIKLQEVHRFVNTPIEKDGNLYWDVPQLMQELETGLQKAYAIAPFESIGIDTWGVDYGMLDKDGKLMGNPPHYRDKRSEGYSERLCAQMTSETLYARTGTQIMDINTLFQLMSQRDDEGFSGCHKMLLMPDLFAYLLTGDNLGRTLHRKHHPDALGKNRHMGHIAFGRSKYPGFPDACNCRKRYRKGRALTRSAAASFTAADPRNGSLRT